MNQEFIIGNYRVTHKIGEGGMGVVYAGQHTVLGRQAAIKLLLPEHLGDEQLSARFINEAKALASIRHPGIVEVYDFGPHQGGGLFIAMELLQGEDLEVRNKRGVPLTAEQAVLFAMQACGTLEAAHRQGITHRDLKPSNIFVVPDPQVPGGERIKLLDFGIAKFAVSGDNGVAMTRAGAIMGTPTYMSPEQCLDSSKVDRRSDIYAMGCIVYEMLTGRPPFVSSNVVDTMTMQIHDTPALPSSVRPDLPKALDAVVLKAMEKDRDQRYQRAGEFAAALQQAMGNVNLTGGWLDASLGVSNTTLTGAAGTMAGGGSRSRWVIPLTAIITLGLGLGAFLYMQKQNDKTADKPDKPPVVEPVDKNQPPPPPAFEQLASDDTSGVTAPEGEVLWIITSDPPGAEVRYKDKPVGHTAKPLAVRIRKEPTRKERLMLKLDGYVDKPLDLSTDQPYSEKVVLGKKIKVAIITKPSSGAQVYLAKDESYQGNTNMEMEFAEGEKIAILIKKEGYRTVEREITFDKDHEEQIKLEKLDLVSVRIESDPEGAEVWLGDAKLGVTPYTDTLEKQKDGRKYVIKKEGCKDQKVRLSGRRDDAKVVKLKCE